MSSEANKKIFDQAVSEFANILVLLVDDINQEDVVESSDITNIKKF